MDINQLLHDMRNNIEYDECGITKITREALNMLADIIEQQGNDIKEKQQHLENLEKVNEDMEERIAIMSEGGWHKTAEEKPKLKTDFPFESITVICADKDSKHERTYPLKWCRRKVRGKIVYRWEYMYDNICYNEPYYWQYLPEPPKEGEAE